MAAATSKFVLAEVGQGVLELDRLRLLRVGLGRGGELELGQHEVAVRGAGPGPCLGSLSSASTSRRMPVMPVRSVSATIV